MAFLWIKHEFEPFLGISPRLGFIAYIEAWEISPKRKLTLNTTLHLLSNCCGFFFYRNIASRAALRRICRNSLKHGVCVCFPLETGFISGFAGRSCCCLHNCAAGVLFSFINSSAVNVWGGKKWQFICSVRELNGNTSSSLPSICIL